MSDDEFWQRMARINETLRLIREQLERTQSQRRAELADPKSPENRFNRAAAAFLREWNAKG
jgi:hypothetical protein